MTHRNCPRYPYAPGPGCEYPHCACHVRDDESLHATDDPHVKIAALDALDVPTKDLTLIGDTINPMHHFADPRPPLVRAPVRYVCGFAMGPHDVLLLTKAKPEWQAGKLNGVGGKVEPHDTSLRGAMAREFFEETGVQVREYNWTLFHTERFNADGSAHGGHAHTEVYFLFARVGSAIMREACEHTAKQSEPCSVHHWRTLASWQEPVDHPPCISNVPYLLRMAEHYWHNLMIDRPHFNPVPYIGEGVIA